MDIICLGVFHYQCTFFCLILFNFYTGFCSMAKTEFSTFPGGCFKVFFFNVVEILVYVFCKYFFRYLSISISVITSFSLLLFPSLSYVPFSREFQQMDVIMLFLLLTQYNHHPMINAIIMRAKF